MTKPFENPSRTARYRNVASAPTRRIAEEGKLQGRILDFGCGRGKDVDYIASLGLDVVGYDPTHRPDVVEGKFDTILCNYVCNVVDAPTTREIVRQILKLLTSKGVAYITVRRDLKEDTMTQRKVNLHHDLLVNGIRTSVDHTAPGKYQTYIVRKGA